MGTAEEIRSSQDANVKAFLEGSQDTLRDAERTLGAGGVDGS
jgi:hypothetical protein